MIWSFDRIRCETASNVTRRRSVTMVDRVLSVPTPIRFPRTTRSFPLQIVRQRNTQVDPFRIFFRPAVESGLALLSTRSQALSLYCPSIDWSPRAPWWGAALSLVCTIERAFSASPRDATLTRSVTESWVEGLHEILFDSYEPMIEQQEMDEARMQEFLYLSVSGRF